MILCLSYSTRSRFQIITRMWHPLAGKGDGFTTEERSRFSCENASYVTRAWKAWSAIATRVVLVWHSRNNSLNLISVSSGT